jgi:hypothetical protein
VIPFLTTWLFGLYVGYDDEFDIKSVFVDEIEQ